MSKIYMYKIVTWDSINNVYIRLFQIVRQGGDVQVWRWRGVGGLGRRGKARHEVRGRRRRRRRAAAGHLLA